MSVNSNALTYRNNAKDHVQIPLATTKYDSRIDMLINVASGMIERLTKRKLTDRTVTEFHDGRANNRMQTYEWPITGGPAVGSKPEIFLDGESVFGSETVVPIDEYDVSDRQTSILRYRGIFSKGYRNVKITYDHGYGIVTQSDIDGTGTNTLPSDLEYACLELVSWFYHSTSSERVGILNRGKTGESTSFEQRLPQHIQLLLEPYIREEFANSEVGVRNG